MVQDTLFQSGIDPFWVLLTEPLRSAGSLFSVPLALMVGKVENILLRSPYHDLYFRECRYQYNISR
jgi:hypothetical protein